MNEATSGGCTEMLDLCCGPEHTDVFAGISASRLTRVGISATRVPHIALSAAIVFTDRFNRKRRWSGCGVCHPRPDRPCNTGPSAVITPRYKICNKWEVSVSGDYSHSKLA